MKKTIWLALTALLFWACTPEPFKSPDGSYDLTAGIEGSWTMESVVIEDRSFPTFTTLDITEYFSEGLNLTFNPEDQSYEVIGTLEGHPFGASGSYAFDDDEFPTAITFTPANPELGTATISLGNMVRIIDPSMTLLHNRSSCDQQYAQYQYTFNRTN